MNKRRLIFIALLTPLVIAILATLGLIYLRKEMRAGIIPAYEVGEHRGAEFCGTCHQEIYDQWVLNGRHKEATASPGFLDFKAKFTGNVAFNTMMGEEACYACHGLKEVDEGVNCETCHGIAPSDVEIMETHQVKFAPGREELREPDFCAKCHQAAGGPSGDLVMGVYSEWQESEAAANGITCQECHMEPREGELRYHGFDTVSRNVEIYRGDLDIRDIELDFPQFSLTIENLVTGHAVPPTGPSKILVLEMSFLDSEGAEIHNIVESFGKKVELMPLVGLMPDKVIENTSLQSGEVRPLSYTLPSSIEEDQISNVVLTLRFYEVADDLQGDLTQAHLITDPILAQEFSP